MVSGTAGPGSLQDCSSRSEGGGAFACHDTLARWHKITKATETWNVTYTRRDCRALRSSYTVIWSSCHHHSALFPLDSLIMVYGIICLRTRGQHGNRGGDRGWLEKAQQWMTERVEKPRHGMTGQLSGKMLYDQGMTKKLSYCHDVYDVRPVPPGHYRPAWRENFRRLFRKSEISFFEGIWPAPAPQHYDLLPIGSDI